MSEAAGRLALRGDLLDLVAEPGWGDTSSAAVRFRPGHWLLVDGGRIVGAQVEPPDAGWRREDHGGRLVMPGFVDTHVHSPQLDVIERPWRLLRRRATLDRVFESLAALRRSLRASLCYFQTARGKVRSPIARSYARPADRKASAGL